MTREEIHAAWDAALGAYAAAYAAGDANVCCIGCAYQAVLDDAAKAADDARADANAANKAAWKEFLAADKAKHAAKRAKAAKAAKAAKDAAKASKPPRL